MSDERYDVGCLMADVEPFDELRALQLDVQNDHLHRHGIPEDPHVTLLFGITTPFARAFSSVCGVLDAPHRLSVAREVSVFRNERFDVVKIAVEDGWPRRVNRALRMAVPYTNGHENYSPHITVAYTEPGLGDRYDGTPVRAHSVVIRGYSYTGPDTAKLYYRDTHCYDT